MKRALILGLAVVAALTTVAQAADLGPIIINAHFIPGVEATGEDRPWDVSFSFGLGITFEDESNLEIHVVTDSHVTSLGLWGHFQARVTDNLGIGAGGTILWPVANQETFMQPVIETYARAEAIWRPDPLTRGSADLSFPILTLADRGDHWEIVPLASLPSLSVGGATQFADDAALEGRLTVQPILIDTTTLTRPIGRISDQLLILPTASTGLRYMP